MSNASIPSTLTLDDAIRTIAGSHYATLKGEFVDFANDMRVATVRELTDLGVDGDTAAKCLYVVREVYVGKPLETVMEEA